MADFLFNYYDWIKALHVISIIAWMAGLLYLPRIFVYHAQLDEADTATSETFKVMERKLLRLIMNPAMIAAWIFGCLMLYADTSLFTQGWMHLKLTCIVLMTVIHHVFARWRKQFEKNENTKDHRYYRWWNEVPTVLMIIIIFCAIVQPF